MEDPFELQRFVTAQAAVIERVRQELRSGQKQSHWMWFVFPQLQGLGSSRMSRIYALSGIDEALAYLAHPVLGPRLLDCVRLVNAIEGKTAYEIFASPDDVKFRSSMDLFHAAAPETAEFRKSLEKYFAGRAN